MEKPPRNLLVPNLAIESSDPFDNVVENVKDWLERREGLRVANPVVAIAGFSGSGKSELARRLLENVGGCVVALDDYYKVHTSYDERPDAFLASYATHLRRLSSGFKVKKSPVFDLVEGVRRGWIGRKAPNRGEPIITEGLFTIYLLREMILSGEKPVLPIYVASTDDLCLRRWGHRANVAGRVHPEPLTAEKWASMVKDYSEFASEQQRLASHSGYSVLNMYDPSQDVSLGVVL